MGSTLCHFYNIGIGHFARGYSRTQVSSGSQVKQQKVLHTVGHGHMRSNGVKSPIQNCLDWLSIWRVGISFLSGVFAPVFGVRKEVLTTFFWSDRYQYAINQQGSATLAEPCVLFRRQFCSNSIRYRMLSGTVLSCFILSNYFNSEASSKSTQ